MASKINFISKKTNPPQKRNKAITDKSSGKASNKAVILDLALAKYVKIEEKILTTNEVILNGKTKNSISNCQVVLKELNHSITLVKNSPIINYPQNQNNEAKSI